MPLIEQIPSLPFFQQLFSIRGMDKLCLLLDLSSCASVQLSRNVGFQKMILYYFYTTNLNIRFLSTVLSLSLQLSLCV